MDEFVRQIENYIVKKDMLSSGETVVLGVSGGADSVSLLLVMHELRAKYALSLKVVHVNHGLRPEAKEEAEYVGSLCRRWDIPFILAEYDVLKLAEENGIGTEEMGRNIRYELFGSTLGSDHGVIAVAHNMNDRAETMLFNLARGTGAKGLGSIPPKRDRIIRPLLCVTRQEIEDFLNRRGIGYCTDESNFSDDYSRNRIRNNVLPVMKEQISEDLIEHMSETADQLLELNSFAEAAAEEVIQTSILRKSPDEVVISRECFNKAHPYLQKVIVKKIIDMLVPHNRDITHSHLESVVKISGQTGNHRVNLPYCIVFSASYDELAAYFSGAEQEKDELKDINLRIGGQTDAGKLGRLVCRVVKRDKNYVISSKQYTKCFDYDKVKEVPSVRTRQTGDRIVINSLGGSKKLKSYFIDEKIPENERDSVPLIADGSNIMWVVGYRISEAYKITDDTENILEITYYREENQ